MKLEKIQKNVETITLTEFERRQKESKQIIVNPQVYSNTTTKKPGDVRYENGDRNEYFIFCIKENREVEFKEKEFLKGLDKLERKINKNPPLKAEYLSKEKNYLEETTISNPNINILADKEYENTMKKILEKKYMDYTIVKR